MAEDVDNFLVYTILLALQLVGFDAADEYSIDVLTSSRVIHTLEVRREGPIVHLTEEDETVLEVERSSLYAHMYTAYTSAQAAPMAFSVLDAILMIPTRPTEAFSVALTPQEAEAAGLAPGETAVIPAFPQATAAEIQGEGTEEPGLPVTEIAPEAEWRITPRTNGFYLSSRDLVVVLTRTFTQR